MYRIKAYQIPEAGRQAKGTPIVNLLELNPDEKISAMIPVREYDDTKNIVMATKCGIIKKSSLTEYEYVPKGGKIALKLDDGDELIRVKLTDGEQDMFIGTYLGKLVRFSEHDVRTAGRVSRGVRAIKLSANDYVVGMSVARENTNLLIVTENGYGKKTAPDEYRFQSRGGKGSKAHKLTEKTGNIVGMNLVSDNDDIILITSEGVIIRLDTRDISTISRVTQGVRLVRLPEGEKVVALARIEKDEEEPEIDAQAEQAEELEQTEQPEQAEEAESKEAE